MCPTPTAYFILNTRNTILKVHHCVTFSAFLGYKMWHTFVLETGNIILPFIYSNNLITQVSLRCILRVFLGQSNRYTNLLPCFQVHFHVTNLYVFNSEIFLI
jgi:hypothetical protein